MGKNAISFVIITGGNEWGRVEKIIGSIIDNRTIDYHEKQIIVIGGRDAPLIVQDWCDYIPWNEDDRPGWITAKKNVGTKVALHENIVYLHDYVVLQPGWYEGFCKFNKEDADWDVMMTRVLNSDDTRTRDWVAWDDANLNSAGWVCYEKWCPHGLRFMASPVLVPYSYNQTNKMVVGGAYWIAKKQFMLENPLNETLMHCQAEDVEWCLRIRNKWRYRMNTYSTVKYSRYKRVEFREIYE